jgi:hypothetical protein
MPTDGVSRKASFIIRNARTAAFRPDGTLSCFRAERCTGGGTRGLLVLLARKNSRPISPKSVAFLTNRALDAELISDREKGYGVAGGADPIFPSLWHERPPRD